MKQLCAALHNGPRAAPLPPLRRAWVCQAFGCRAACTVPCGLSRCKAGAGLASAGSESEVCADPKAAGRGPVGALGWPGARAWVSESSPHGPMLTEQQQKGEGFVARGRVRQEWKARLVVGAPGWFLEWALSAVIWVDRLISQPQFPYLQNGPAAHPPSRVPALSSEMVNSLRRAACLTPRAASATAALNGR